MSALGTRTRDGVWVSGTPATDMSPNQWRCREDKAAQGRSHRKWLAHPITGPREVVRLKPHRSMGRDRALSGLNKYTGSLKNPPAGLFRGTNNDSGKAISQDRS
jgi:hypothetical protein